MKKMNKLSIVVEKVKKKAVALSLEEQLSAELKKKQTKETEARIAQLRAWIKQDNLG